MKSTGTYSLMAPTGPWLWLGALNDRAFLGGHRVGVRLTIDPDTGVTTNVGVVPLGSLVLGWMPNHRRCTGLLEETRIHRCLWKHAPHIRVQTAPEHRDTPRTAGDSSPVQ